MTTLPKLTVESIRSRCDEKVYARGLSYYKDGAVVDTVRRGNELEGYCEGSMPSPYHIQVTLGNDGVEAATCNCEYDWGGDCKHIVALLLTYVHKPQVFEERAPVQDVLAERSKEDLIALIREMITRHPELSILIDRPVPGSQKRNTPVNTESFRRELRHAMNSYEGWGDTTPADSLRSIATTVAQFAAQGDWRSASAIYNTILEESSVNDEYLFDDDGEFVSAVNDVVEDYVKCLDQPDIANDDTARQAILLRLVDTELWDIKTGGIGIGDSIEMADVFVNYAKPPDFPLIRAKLETAKRNVSRSNWGTEAIEDILAELDLVDDVDPTIVLNRLREEGHYRLLFEKLLTLKRTEEAIAVVRQYLTTPYELAQVVWKLAQAGAEDTAISLARDTVNKQYDQFLSGWLMETYKRRGDKEAYFELVHKQMLAIPHEAHYVELKAAADALDKWKTLHPEIIAWLRKQKHFKVLAEVYLTDEEWDAAWETLERNVLPREATNGWLYHGLDLKVAMQSRHVRPKKAIPVYVKYARWEIGQRDRGHYRAAAEYLTTVRELYLELDDEGAWRKLIADLRAEFPKLRALQEELNKARL